MFRIVCLPPYGPTNYLFRSTTEQARRAGVTAACPIIRQGSHHSSHEPAIILRVAARTCTLPLVSRRLCRLLTCLLVCVSPRRTTQPRCDQTLAPPAVSWDRWRRPSRIENRRAFAVIIC